MTNNGQSKQSSVYKQWTDRSKWCCEELKIVWTSKAWSSSHWPGVTICLCQFEPVWQKKKILDVLVLFTYIWCYLQIVKYFSDFCICNLCNDQRSFATCIFVPSHWSPLHWEGSPPQLPETELLKKIDTKFNEKLDPVGSTVRYEMMKLCTGSV